MEYRVKVLDRQSLAEGLMTFHVERSEGFQYLAGQFCFLTFPAIGYQDKRGVHRHFSVASSPTEKDLLFATKLTTARLNGR